MTAAATSHAQTTFSGGDINTAGNWSAGLPTGGTIGTMNVDGTLSANTTGFDVTQTGGDLEWQGAFNFLDSSTWTLESGASWSGSTDTFIRNNSAVTLDGGSIGGNELWIRGASSVTGSGSMNVELFQFTEDATVNLTNSTITASTYIGHRSKGAGLGTLTLSGSTLTTANLRLAANDATEDFQINFTGASAGSFSFANWELDQEAGADANLLVDFESGTGMVMSGTAITRGLTIGATTYANSEWAEALWANNQLTIDGQTAADLSTDWATANGTIFNFDGTNLSVIPEPNAFALIAGVMVSFSLLRRRRA